VDQPSISVILRTGRRLAADDGCHLIDDVDARPNGGAARAGFQGGSLRFIDAKTNSSNGRGALACFSALAAKDCAHS
jgi:hypothetical protein